MNAESCVPIGEVIGELDVPVTAIPAASPQARHQIFLSYAALDQDLAENFADHLFQNGVKAWVYSIDKTLSGATWSEIKTRIYEAELFAFVAARAAAS